MSYRRNPGGGNIYPPTPRGLMQRCKHFDFKVVGTSAPAAPPSPVPVRMLISCPALAQGGVCIDATKYHSHRFWLYGQIYATLDTKFVTFYEQYRVFKKRADKESLLIIEYQKVTMAEQWLMHHSKANCWNLLIACHFVLFAANYDHDKS